MTRPAGTRRAARGFALAAATVAILAAWQTTGWAGVTSGIGDRAGRARAGVGDAVDTTTDTVLDTTDDAVDQATDVTGDAVASAPAPNPIEDVVEQAADAVSDTSDTAVETVAGTEKTVKRAGSATDGLVGDATTTVVHGLGAAAPGAGEVGISGPSAPGGTFEANARPAAGVTTTGTAAAFLRKPGTRGQAEGDRARVGDLPSLVSLGNALTGDAVLGNRIGKQGETDTGRLAFTGAGLSGYIAVGMLLLATGTVLVLMARRRRTGTASTTVVGSARA